MAIRLNSHFTRKTAFRWNARSRTDDGTDAPQFNVHYAAAVCLDRALSLSAVLPAFLLQLLERQRVSADSPPPHTRKLRASLHESALPHGDPALTAHRVFGRGPVVTYRLSAGLLSCLPRRTPSVPALSGSHRSAMDQLPCARLCMEGHLRQRRRAQYASDVDACGIASAQLPAIQPVCGNRYTHPHLCAVRRASGRRLAREDSAGTARILERP